MNMQARLSAVSNRAVRLQSEHLADSNYHLSSVTYDMNGKISSFKTNEDGIADEFTFIFVRNDDFIVGDMGLRGYCQLKGFRKYINQEIDIYEIVKPVYWFRFEDAEIGDTFEIDKVVYELPYTIYYKRSTYTFAIADTAINFENTAVYPLSASSQLNTVDLTGNATESFFNINFANKVNTWNISADEKLILMKWMTKICFKIHWIRQEILSTIVMEELGTIGAATLAHYTNPQVTNTTYDGLTRIDKLVGEMLKDWGYFYQANSLLPPKDMMFGTDAAAYNRYYNGLLNFYKSLYNIDESVFFPKDSDGYPINELGIRLTNDPILRSYKDSERRLAIILTIISDTALNAISSEDRIKLLDDILNKPVIYENTHKAIDEENVLKLLGSFKNQYDADLLLDFLLIQRNGNKNNFEFLYLLMDDDRLERYLFLGWFIDQAPNRKYFIYLLYEIWKLSKYNMSFIPSGVTANDDGLNPNAFFLSPQGTGYYAQYDNSGAIISGSNPVLEFHKIGDIFHSEDNKFDVEKKLENEKIVVNRIKNVAITGTALGTGGLGTGIYTANLGLYGKYHLYQPICLLGYQADWELVVPNTQPIPAFLFYYSVDFDKVKDFDAALSATIEVAIDVAFFFATGGFGTLRHLKHLKYITKIFRAGSLPANEAVLVWRGVEAGAQVLSIGAGTMTSFFNYRANTTNDPELVALNRKLCYFFLALTLGSAGGTIYSSRKTVKCADEVVEEMNNLTNAIPSKPHGMSIDVMGVIVAVGSIDQKIVLMSNKLNTLPFDAGIVNNVAAHYNDVSFFTKEQRFAFYSDFHGVDDISDWLRLNENNAQLVNIWKSVKSFTDVRKNIGFLTTLQLAYNSSRIDNHILQLDLITTSGGGLTIQGGHHLSSIIANLPSGYSVSILESTPLLQGFRRVKMQVNLPPGLFPGAPVRFKKGTLLPDIWDRQRVMEEIAYAWWKAGTPMTVGPHEIFFRGGLKNTLIIRLNAAEEPFLDNVLFFDYP